MKDNSREDNDWCYTYFFGILNWYESKKLEEIFRGEIKNLFEYNLRIYLALSTKKDDVCPI